MKHSVSCSIPSSEVKPPEVHSPTTHVNGFYKEHLIEGTSGVLAVRDYGGNERPVLLLHGLGRTLVDWELVSSYLHPSFRCVSLDLPCHGKSSDSEWDWAKILSDIEAVSSRLQLHRPAMVGHSLGGMVAAMWSREHPECPGAANLDGFGRGRPHQYVGYSESQVNELFRIQEAKTLKLIRRLAEPMDEPGFQDYVRMRAPFSEPEILAIHEESARRGTERLEDGRLRIRPSPDLVKKIQEAIRGVELFEVYGATRAPLLLVLSNTGEDPPAPEPMRSLYAGYREGIRRGIEDLKSRSSLVDFAETKGGHDVHIKCPRVVANLVRDFLRKRP